MGAARAPTEELVHPRLVGPTRVALARIESLAPRRIVAPVEDALLSPTFIRIARKAQATTRAILHAADQKTTAPPLSVDDLVDDEESLTVSAVPVPSGPERLA